MRLLLLLLLLFISLLFHCSTAHLLNYGYCYPDDADCMKAWSKCRGDQVTGLELTFVRAFWEDRVLIANQCLKKFRIKPITITTPKEDPHGGAPGGPEQFEGLIERHIKTIKNREAAVDFRCCYADGIEYLDEGRKINEDTIMDLINMRFLKEYAIRNALLEALLICKRLPIIDCDLVPFRDCMLETCIEDIKPKLSLCY